MKRDLWDDLQMATLCAVICAMVIGMVYLDQHLWFCSHYTCTANAPGWPDHFKPGWGFIR